MHLAARVILNRVSSPSRVLTKLVALALLGIGALGFAAAVRGAGQGQYVKVDYPASTAEGELQTAVTYTLWVPEGVTTLRGLIVHQHGAGTTASKEGSTAAYDLHWQTLAKKWDCALLGPSYHVLNEHVDTTPGGSEHWFDPRRGSEKTFLRGLGDLAAKSGHPELPSVPWILWGHSGGGIWANVMAALYPDRVVALWLRSGTVTMFRLGHAEFPALPVPDALYAIPCMANPGVKEKPNDVYKGNLATFKKYRAKGGLIGFALDPRTGHECGDSRYLAIPFLDACMATRLPDKGSHDQTLKPMDTSHAWLAPVLGDTALPAAEYKGNPLEAVWLPNENVAKAWMEYVKTGAVSDSTPPPAPSDVKVSTQGERGTEITWSADADFESGIGQFIVLRDGTELAKVPEKPVGRFGRPLFQGMTYHDTPDQPLREMRYLDTAAKGGEKHEYAIVTVNSVGLKSEPSAAAKEIGATVKLAVSAAAQSKHSPETKYPTYNGLIMAGYQGWFRAEGDGTNSRFSHYFSSESRCGIDAWPDVSEYEKTYETPFRMADGTPARLFSSHDQSTVALHFKWMKQYGVDGVFVQRFYDATREGPRRNAGADVLRFALQAASEQERAIAVMYDLSGLRASGEDCSRIAADWKFLVDTLKVTNQPGTKTYLHHRGKPLVAIWGVGFPDRPYNIRKIGLERLIDFLHNDPEYGGCSVMLGVPTYWRDLNSDCNDDPYLHELIKKADLVMPWMVQRFTPLLHAEMARYRDMIRGDMKWCQANHVDYVPCVCPGFSWHNLSRYEFPDDVKPVGSIPRQGGRFYWQQIATALGAGADKLYVAMFDEVNEGTAIFKCTDHPPVSKLSSFINMDGKPADHYLWLTGEAAKMLRKEKPLSAQMPRRD